ncbi:MAG: family 43 glycosylhydrolase [Verrucomicrobiae bacterium]|nr:family 43 glycosylhydrolase [Verrucomicrobiae bacterium]
MIHFGGRYLMYYSLPPFAAELAPTNAPRGWSVGIAESQDLIKWRKVAELWPAQECDQNGLCAPAARVWNGQVHLFYQTYGNGPRDAICYASSKDGLHFQRHPDNPIFRPTGDWNNGRAIDAEPFIWQNQWWLYFATRDPSGRTQMLGVATASLSNAISRAAWKLQGHGPILRPELPWETRCIEAPSVTLRGDTFVMFYAGGYNNDPQQIGVATSRDGVQWTRLATQPFLAHGPPGSWNHSESGHPGIFEDPDGHTYLFFQGNPDRGRTWMISAVEVLWDDFRPRLLPHSRRFPMSP